MAMEDRLELASATSLIKHNSAYNVSSKDGTTTAKYLHSEPN